MTGGHCLAIESATSMLSIALTDGSTTAIRELEGVRTHAENVYALIGELLSDGGIAARDLDCVAFGAGPGGFTGVRLAVATAQGVAYAADAKVCGISSLQAMAMRIMLEQGCERVLAVLDARRGEVYSGEYRLEDGVAVPEREDRVHDPLALDCGRESAYAVGNGWRAYPELASRCGDLLTGLDADCRPAADMVALLALTDRGRLTWCPPAQAEPNYVRDKVADLPAAARRTDRDPR